MVHKKGVKIFRVNTVITLRIETDMPLQIVKTQIRTWHLNRVYILCYSSSITPFLAKGNKMDAQILGQLW